MTADDLIALNEQIAAMARAGVPLDQGLAGLAQDMGRGRLRRVTQALAEDLRAGHPLPEALERRKGQVPPYYANLVTAGVHTGRLPEVLATLTTYARSIATTRMLVIEALSYPGIVLVIGFILFSMMSIAILPQFKTMFDEFGLTLPAMTRFILLFGEYPFELLFLPAAIFVGGLTAMWMFCRLTPWGRRAWSQFVDLVPLVGPLIRSARMAAFTDLLGMLVEYGVPLPLALQLAGSASSNPLMTARSRQVEARLAQGMGFAESFRGQRLLPAWVAWMASAGEQRGGLASALREIATVYRRQVESRSTVLRTILPPFVVIMTAGFLTGFFVSAMIFPMIKLLEGLSK